MAEAVANTNVLTLLKKNVRLELPENILFQDVAFIASTVATAYNVVQRLRG